MPDFASIYQMANKPTVALQSPMEAQARALQLQGMAGQQELQQGQIQQQGIQNQMLQQQFADTQRVRQSISTAASQPGDTLANISQALQKDGSPTALKYLENITTMGKNIADLDSTKLGLIQKHLTLLGNSLGATTNAQEAANKIIYHAQQGDIQPQQAQDLLGSLQAIGNDPKMFQTWKQIHTAELGASQELLGAITPKTTVQGINAVTINPATNEATAQPIPGMRPEITGVHADPNNNAFGVDKFGNAVPILGPNGQPQKMRPPAAVIMNAQMNGPAVPAQPGQFAPDPTRPWRANPNFQAIAGKNATMASDVDSALNNDYKFGGSRGIMYDRQVQHLAQQIDPAWRQGNYDLKQKMLSDPQVVAANAAVMHLNDFMNDYKQLSPQTSSVLLNTPINKWTSLVNGNSPDAAILARLQTTAMSVAGEYGKALGGSDAVLSEHERQALFDPSRTQGQLAGVTGAVSTLMQRTVNAKENVTRRTSPNSMPLTLMDPDSVEAMRAMGINYNPGGKARGNPPAANPPGQSLPTIASPADPAFKNLAPGSHFLGPDGVERVKH